MLRWLTKAASFIWKTGALGKEMTEREVFHFTELLVLSWFPLNVSHWLREKVNWRYLTLWTKKLKDFCGLQHREHQNEWVGSCMMLIANAVYLHLSSKTNRFLASLAVQASVFMYFSITWHHASDTTRIFHWQHQWTRATRSTVNRSRSPVMYIAQPDTPHRWCPTACLDFTRIVLYDLTGKNREGQGKNKKEPHLRVITHPAYQTPWSS